MRSVDADCCFFCTISHYYLTKSVGNLNKLKYLVCHLGGEASSHQAHTFLSHALREGPVQQPAVEELERTGIITATNHWEQL